MTTKVTPKTYAWTKSLHPSRLLCEYTIDDCTGQAQLMIGRCVSGIGGQCCIRVQDLVMEDDNLYKCGIPLIPCYDEDAPAPRPKMVLEYQPTLIMPPVID